MAALAREPNLASLTTQAARDRADRLAQKYIGPPFDSERVVLKISPLRPCVRPRTDVIE